MHQNLVVQLFVGTYNTVVSGSYRIVRWPDQKPGSTNEIDAYAEDERLGALAVEHTLVQTYAGQKQDDARFLQVMAGLERRVVPTTSRINVTIPTRAIPTGVDWQEMSRRLEEWLLENMESLPFDKPIKGNIHGVPFEVTVHRRCSSKPGLFVSRFAPEELDEVENIKKALRTKKDKLARYKNQATTLLLLESDDISLPSHVSLYKAFLQAEKAVPNDIEQVWLADTFGDCTEPSSCQFLCFRGPREVMQAANPENFLITPECEDYWWEQIRREDS